MWKQCIENSFQNCRKIYPIQQKKVRQLIDYYAAYPEVKKILIFGSSVMPQCHIDSDVDVYLEKSEDVRIKSPCVDFPCDIWSNYTVDERLYQEIRKKGVTVYER